MECRGNICLGTHEIGCEISTTVCLQRTEIHKKRERQTKDILTVWSDKAAT